MKKGWSGALRNNLVIFCACLSVLVNALSYVWANIFTSENASYLHNFFQLIFNLDTKNRQVKKKNEVLYKLISLKVNEEICTNPICYHAFKKHKHYLIQEVTIQLLTWNQEHLKPTWWPAHSKPCSYQHRSDEAFEKSDLKCDYGSQGPVLPMAKAGIWAQKADSFVPLKACSTHIEGKSAIR